MVGTIHVYETRTITDWDDYIRYSNFVMGK